MIAYRSSRKPNPSSPAARRAMLAATCAAAVWIAPTGGCGRQQMTDQPRLEPLEASDFFADQRGSRHQVEGTVARGYRRDAITRYSQHLMTGMIDGQPAQVLPPEVLEDSSLHEVLQRGRGRYEIFCSHCHDLVGTGEGVVPQRGYPFPPTLHSRRLRQAPLGHFFQVISTGKGRMPPHGGQIAPADRWAIAAYIRALQLSQHAPAAELSAQEREQVQQASRVGGESE